MGPGWFQKNGLLLVTAVILSMAAAQNVLANIASFDDDYPKARRRYAIGPGLAAAEGNWQRAIEEVIRTGVLSSIVITGGGLTVLFARRRRTRTAVLSFVGMLVATLVVGIALGRVPILKRATAPRRPGTAMQLSPSHIDESSAAAMKIV